MSGINGNDSRPVLVVSADHSRGERVAEVWRKEGRTTTVETRGAEAAALLGEGTDAAGGLLVLDLLLPELDRQRLREAMGEQTAPPEPLEAVERRQIAAMLQYTAGNRRKAAQLLGLARSTLLAKIRRYELETPVDAAV
jgi:DNA-binding NtrC family response regulator